MRPSLLSVGLLTIALATLDVSVASAQEFHHRYYHYGPVGAVFGLAGAVVVGAVTIATAPIVILADVLSGGRHHRYYQRDGAYDRHGSAYDYEGPNSYAGPRDGYYPDAPPGAHLYRPQGYAPPQDFNGERYPSYPSDEAYNAPGRGYYSAPPGAYYGTRDYEGDRRDYGPSMNSDRSEDDNYSAPPGRYGYGRGYGTPPGPFRGQPDDDDSPPPDGE